MTTDISIVRWDPTLQQEIAEDYEYDGGNSSSRLFERSRIKALAGKITIIIKITYLYVCIYDKICLFFGLYIMLTFYVIILLSSLIILSI